MKCLVLVDQKTELVKKVCSVLERASMVIEVCQPQLLEKKTSNALNSFTHTVLVQTECEYQITVLFGEALQEVAHTAMLGLRLDWLSMAREQQSGIMVAQSLPHAEEFPIHHDGKGVFVNLPSPFLGKRHSTFALGLREGCTFNWTAKTSYGEVVALSESSNRYLLNLHDEVLFGPIGEVILKNFLAISPSKPKPRRYNLGGPIC